MNFADNYYKKTIIQKMVQKPELIAAFCLGTNMPLVECSQETYCDRAYVFDTEEQLKEFARPYFEKKLPLRGIKYLAKDKMKFFTMLLCINVDELVYTDENGSHVIQVSDFIKRKDFSNLPEGKRPVENPQLQLSGIYFVQEASRNVPTEEKQNLKELEEELAANIVKGKYILPIVLTDAETEKHESVNKSADEVQTESTFDNAQMQKDRAADEERKPATAVPGDPRAKQIRIPLVKTPQGDVFQPIFTDNIEFDKYNRNQQCKALVVPFKGLREMLAGDAKGYLLNPNGFHINLTRELLNGLTKRFPTGE